MCKETELTQSGAGVEEAEEGKTKKNELTDPGKEGDEDVREAEGRGRSLGAYSEIQKNPAVFRGLERKREPERKEDWLGTKAWRDLASRLGWGAAGQSCLSHGASSQKYLLLESRGAS